jgi:hypothetical protein
MAGQLVMSNQTMASTEVEDRISAAIGRIADFRTHWRVLVETWPSASQYEGRLVFRSDDHEAPPPREGPATLHGRTREDVLRAAYDLPESRLREMLRSLA